MENFRGRSLRPFVRRRHALHVRRTRRLDRLIGLYVATLDHWCSRHYATAEQLKVVIRVTAASACVLAILLIIGERDAELRRSEWREEHCMPAHDLRLSLSVIRSYAEMLEHFPEKRAA